MGNAFGKGKPAAAEAAAESEAEIARHASQGGAEDLEALGIKVKTFEFNTEPEEIYRADLPDTATSVSFCAPPFHDSDSEDEVEGDGGDGPGVEVSPEAALVAAEAQAKLQADEEAAAMAAAHLEAKRKASKENWGAKFKERRGSFH